MLASLSAAALLVAAASLLFPGLDREKWLIVTAALWLPLGVGFILPSLREMRLEGLAFPAVLAGWASLVMIYDIRSIALVLLGFALIGGTRLGSDWVVEKLWDGRPEKRLATGVAILISTIVLFVAIEPFSLLPSAPTEAFSVPLAVLALSYAAITGGTLLSLALVASGARQAIQRWRYYRGIRGQDGRFPSAADVQARPDLDPGRT